MPEISLFFGIRVTMYYEDHQPPHFHAAYNQDELMQDWELAKDNLPLNKIAPLM